MHQFLLVYFIICLVVCGSVRRDSPWMLQFKPCSGCPQHLRVAGLGLELRNWLFIYDKWGFLYSCQLSAAVGFPVCLIFFIQYGSLVVLLICERCGVLQGNSGSQQMCSLGCSFKYYLKCYFKSRSHITNIYFKIKDMAILCIMTPTSY